MRFPLTALLGLVSTYALAQESAAGVDLKQPEGSSQEEPTESDLSDPPERKIVKKWNEYDLKYLTLQWGVYTLVDWGTVAQSPTSLDQVGTLTDDVKLRDFRFTLKGRLKLEREVTYTMGLMYDGPSNSWFPRETGIQVAIPELWGNVFIGRQKEGISLNKITVGYAVWMMERMPISEATIPIMTDGIKWLGGLPNKRANWNIGFFYNFLPKSPSTGMYTTALVARAAWLPLLPEKEGALLHLGLGYHWGKFADGEARLRARPESSTAPFFLDTGTFPARQNHLFVAEAYLRKRNWTYGAEYFFDQVRSSQVEHPFFHGGEAFASWLITGEERPYHDLGGKLGFIEPERSAFEGALGAFEGVLHLSYSDFASGPVQGGTFWRLTPQLNWYLDSMVRLSFNYGLGFLNRFAATGVTHFFQARVQYQIQ